MQPNDQIDVCLEKQYHRFRWKSEVKSNVGDKISSHGSAQTEQKKSIKALFPKPYQTKQNKTKHIKKSRAWTLDNKQF